MRRGFSLPELVLALAVSGILLALAIPKLADAVDHIEVRAAAHNIAAAHQRARFMAAARSRVLVLSVDQNELIIRPRGGVNVIWSQAGPAASRVVLAGPARQFIFVPEGMTLGLSNASLRLTRGAAARTVTVSRLGRVRVGP